jgi:hypothetical protein
MEEMPRSNAAKPEGKPVASSFKAAKNASKLYSLWGNVAS